MNNNALLQIENLMKDVDTNLVSDGYHTFGELYEHRIVLYIMLAKRAQREGLAVWCTTKHNNGEVWPGWMILGIHKEAGRQITYHLADTYWDEVSAFAEVIECSPKYDGHTSADVLARLKML
jgi:hypothetical protein